MVARTQISMEPELHKRAKVRAAQLGISLAEYVRRLVARDVEAPGRVADPAAVFNLGDSGGSDIARRKDDYVAEAVAAEHPGRARS